MKTSTLFLLILLTALCVQIQAQEQKKTIKTMIVTGQDGSHFWRGSSDAIKRILENSGRFQVDVAVTPDWHENIADFNPDFKKYDLVLINYGGKTWAEPTRKAFEKYVAAGGGVVIVHSSVVPMADWKAYNEFIGLGAWDGRNEKDGPYLYWKDGKYIYDYSIGDAGYHGRQHETTIEHRAPDHPILKGLNPKWKHFKDEIYCRLRGPANSIEILATAYEQGRHEPLIWTVTPGKARIFVTLLGHCGNDPDMTYSMECTGFQVTLLRGAEWAATGSVTQPVPQDFPLADTYTLRPEFKAPFHAH